MAARDLVQSSKGLYTQMIRTIGEQREHLEIGEDERLRCKPEKLIEITEAFVRHTMQTISSPSAVHLLASSRMQCIGALVIINRKGSNKVQIEVGQTDKQAARITHGTDASYYTKAYFLEEDPKGGKATYIGIAKAPRYSLDEEQRKNVYDVEHIQ